MRKVFVFFADRLPLTLGLFIGIALGGILSGGYAYNWGLMDGALVEIRVPCGHDECAAKLRSPLYFMAPDRTTKVSEPDELIEIRLLVPRGVAERLEAELEQVEPEQPRLANRNI